MSTFYTHPEGETIIPYEIPVHIPPVGYVWDYFIGDWAPRPIYSRSENPEDQYWDRPVETFDYDRKRAIEKRKQSQNDMYVDPELDDFRYNEWDRRINGFWFMNNGKATYITGLHYFYLTWWRIDIGYPSYRQSDRDFFYMWKYCEDDPKCFGLIEAARRRSGKTYRACVIMYEEVSRREEANAGIQSKKELDAQIVFAKMIQSFANLPDFFKPNYNTNGGPKPKKKLEFLPQAKKDEDLKPELSGKIDYQASNILAYDSQKLIRYLRDECFGEDTSVRMHDGSSRKVKNIIPGDILMGPDGAPRVVKSNEMGVDDIYEVTPNKGIKFTCTSDHKILFKWCRRDLDLNFDGVKYSFGDIVEVPLRIYMELSQSKRKHLVLFKNDSLYFNKKSLLVDPYTLGVWLGDGNESSGSIYCQEQEIIDKISQKNKYEIRENKPQTSQRKNPLKVHHISGIIKDLREVGVYKNKHIPNDYMYSFEEDRLELLAGLLDTDGHLHVRNGKPCQYEITQKRENLSRSICQLANDLGFYSSLKKKKATMKRGDGSVYSCDVWRVHIYGDLWRIPCVSKVAKKTELHKNRRNPLNKGIRNIENTGLGRYFALKVSGDNKFLLEDGTVVSNCGKDVDNDVSIGWTIVRECLRLGVSQIVGKAFYTTTIEEGGSDNFRKLWDGSDFNDKDEETGATSTGMYRTFTPAYKNVDDFVDKYGICDEEAAKTAMQKERAAKRTNRERAEYIRKYPFDITEAFYSINENCIYDSLKITTQAKLLDVKGNNHWYVTGNLQWENGEVGDDVIFVPNINGRWKINRDFIIANEATPGGLINQFEKIGSQYRPLSDSHAITGADTFDHSLKNVTDEKQASDAAFYTFWRHDPFAPELTDTFVCEYIYRQPDADLMAEDLALQCLYFGTPAIIENNKPGAITWFTRNGLKPFIIKVDGREGISGTPKNKQSMAETTESYISKDIHKVVFHRLLNDWNNFSLENSTAYDAAMGSGWALLIATRIGKKFQKTPDHLHKNRNSPSSLYSRYL